jgi:arginyl-tRNA synthetase
VTTPLQDLRAAVEGAAASLVNGQGVPSARLTLERPPRADLGDYSTNAAMLLAPLLKASPREVAGRLGDALRERLGGQLERVEVAGPGFVNVFLSDAWYAAALERVLAVGADWGRGAAAPVERVNVEFVSANPTGPAHVGHARNAAYGDSLARLLENAGHEVEREFYINDAGSQIQRFGESIQARARGEEVAEDGYRGAYVAELAAAIPGAAEADLEEVSRRGVELMLERMAASLEAFGVHMDIWYSERALHEGEPTPVDHAFARLAELETSYRAEGALWLRTTRFGDDKDRVLERSSGEHTYLASDIAYHLNKRERGFDRLIDVWGADHHGYVQRVKVAFQALGGDPDRLELLIMQFVHLVERGGGRSSMSKRSGEFVTLDELVQEIGVDAARWFLLQRSHDTVIELDLDLAREQSRENPVYYVQYAHARLSSILREAPEPAGEWGSLELHPSERELIKKLLLFPAEAAEAAERRAPHRIAVYALELAQAFSAFYRDCPVLKAESAGLRDFRVALCRATRGVIARALDLLGVSAPDSM